METPHIAVVDVVEGGVVVTYDDASLAFYEEAVLLEHLKALPEQKRAASASDQSVRRPAMGEPKRRARRESRTRAA